MPSHTFNLCLCCGVPFEPSLDDLGDNLQYANTLALVRLNGAIRRDNHVRNMIHDSKEIRFYSKKQEAHVVHKSHHFNALDFVIKEMTTNAGKDFPFVAKPTGRQPEYKIARWDSATNRVDLYNLWERVKKVAPIGPVPNWDLKYTVETCTDCNYAMTTEFWYRFHLYGTNPNRIIGVNSIRIYNATAVHPDVRQGQGRLFPPANFSNREDYFAAYVACYLQSCFPVNVNGVRPILRQLYSKLAWISLQVACCISQYMKGVQGTGYQPRNPKSQLGVLELYVSYFAWTLACGEDPRMMNRLDFKKWHQMYVWDLVNSPLLLEDGVRLIGKEVVPEVMNVDSKLFVRQVSNKLLTLYDRYFIKIKECIITPQIARLDVRAHFIDIDKMEEVCHMGLMALRGNFDEMVNTVGIRAMWNRVYHMSRDLPADLRHRMMQVLFMIEQDEVHRVHNQWHKLNSYRACIYNPVDNRYFRGTWAAVLDLKTIGALD